MKTISTNGLNLVKKFEAFRESMYLDAVSKPTIGYGTLIDTKEEQYLINKKITEAEATDLLELDMAKFEKAINNLVKAELTQNQFDALCSFTYNVGISNFKNSTLLKMINEGKIKESADQFLRWNKAGGKVLSGLTSRRQKEMELFLK